MQAYPSKIEALLFIAGTKGLNLGELSALLGLATSACSQQVEQLATSYEKDSVRAFTLLESGGRFKLATKPAFKPLIESYAKSPTAPRLSQAALETLAIIAYRQPLTRMEIDEVRGVQSSGALQTLMLRQLIEEKGRSESPGRAFLYGTSAYFLDYFGINSLEELPDVEGFEEEATAEIPDLFYKESAGTGATAAENLANEIKLASPEITENEEN